jgi:carboxypeptidase Taq
MMSVIKDLIEEFTELRRLQYIYALLDWDMQVNLPSGSFEGRSEQTSLIREIIHNRLTSEKIGKLISESEKLSDLNTIESAMIREARRDYDQEVKIPTELVKEIAKTRPLSQQAWQEAKQKNDFSIFKPLLEKMIKLQIEVAERLDTGPTLYSTLIDLFEPGATYSWIKGVFDDLKPKLVKVINKINTSNNKPDFSILTRKYDPDKQWNFSVEVVKGLQFDTNYGRQDKSVHPFTTTLSSTDTRITTRIKENFFSTCIFGSIHECGHALYEMGYQKDIHDTILADGASMGIHESQSRMYENIIGRSKDFWTYWFPILKEKYFAQTLHDVKLDDFYRAINTVQPSYIRVDADEVTYGLHIILRFEMEHDIIEGKMDVSEIPSIWNEKFEKLIGIPVKNDSDGMLQDVHWSKGLFGYFPTYALGNLYAAQIYADAIKKNPSLPQDYRKGDFSNILAYLRENVQQYGRIYQPRDLIMRITNEDLNPDYFIKYIENKFYPIYQI